MISVDMLGSGRGEEGGGGRGREELTRICLGILVRIFLACSSIGRSPEDPQDHEFRIIRIVLNGYCRRLRRDGGGSRRNEILGDP